MAVKGHCSMGISSWPPFSFDRTGREKPPDQGIVTGVREGSVLQVGQGGAEARVQLTSCQARMMHTVPLRHRDVPQHTSPQVNAGTSQLLSHAVHRYCMA
jgi:hypothetical protein